MSGIPIKMFAGLYQCETCGLEAVYTKQLYKTAEALYAAVGQVNTVSGIGITQTKEVAFCPGVSNQNMPAQTLIVFTDEITSTLPVSSKEVSGVDHPTPATYVLIGAREVDPSDFF